MAQQEEWFSTWFDSPYYHILYSNRDDHDARLFMDNLLAYLHPKPQHKILDLACGKGRHSLYLNELGYDVTGIDLSEKSIDYARQYENERLHFDVHDMREVYKPESFDFVLNLFTSFGYFESETENVVSLKAAATNLKHGGKLVIDFMNTDRTVERLVSHEQKEVQGILFDISRKVEHDFIVKTIHFEDKGREYCFEERVRALRQENFMEYFRIAQLRLAEVFGDYKLQPFDPEKSERIIFVLKK
ncbi:bifunctional 2-polyprenyl-6-hydroxyphenol methylase/3-demethylubiquinol 3-O-methyltransferase UbiG [Pontibacter sp. HSC-36F09]|uniref:class I SAM-dependent methyltransferase n=1 Tax=Pontibacter sp. HSC-36F09 TaxID=2910966 RepID=UPI00209E1C41|nr:class I SAM-dependent methyltransferase [Pontibacter sp. HSC-36F09]MCP2043050.1 SAM-dependent methyltransferase [Pontibacter sp. HSC-36F09]